MKPYTDQSQPFHIQNQSSTQILFDSSLSEQSAIDHYIAYIFKKLPAVLFSKMTPDKHSQNYIGVKSIFQLLTLPLSFPLAIGTIPIFYVTRKIMQRPLTTQQKLIKALKNQDKVKQFMQPYITEQVWNRAVDKIRENIFDKNSQFIVVVTEWQKTKKQIKNSLQHLFVVGQDTNISLLRQIIKKKVCPNDSDAVYLSMNKKILQNDIIVKDLTKCPNQKIIRLGYVRMQTFG